MAHHVAGVLALAKGDGQVGHWPSSSRASRSAAGWVRRTRAWWPCSPTRSKRPPRPASPISPPTSRPSSRLKRPPSDFRGSMPPPAAGAGWRRARRAKRMARIGSPKRRRRSTRSATASTRPGRGGGTGGRCSGPVVAGGRRDVLAEARDRFAAMGATPWAEQAAAELERVAPGRATGALTEDEARIAALVAEGRRNREIAADLYVSVATVEAHLTRIYRKLGRPVAHRAVAPHARIIAVGDRNVRYVPRRDHADAGVGPVLPLGP